MRGWDSVTQFTEQLFGHLRRADQRRWAHAYVHGLLSTPGKKSIRRLAAVASDSPTASQALHQFINESPWEWEPVCDRLRQWAEDRVQPRAWTAAPVVLPKRGEKSCGVHRRFIPHTGRTVNCQVGTAVFMSTDAGEFPLGWHLFLPETWARGPLREQARIPQAATSSPEGQLLHLIDLMVRRSQYGSAPVVVDLDGYMDSRRLIDGLHQRRRDFIAAIPDSFLLAPLSPHAWNPRLPVTAAVRPAGERRADVLLAATRPGLAPARDSLVQVLGAAAADQRPQPFRLFTQPGTHTAGPGQLWITNMVHRPVGELLRYTQRHPATGETVDLLQRGFGLRDFEGRSFPGWHRHMTLVSAAFTYSRLAADPDRQTLHPGPGTGSDNRARPPHTPRTPWTPRQAPNYPVAV
ncbi:IS701 family transposase [Kitasatospora sp. NPDC056138]|uniref:IS701 family transposase n=1 Tax=Kitasatospora sp. NPDC056138 TaxID=3345724 RepID=UPI0035D7DDA1